MIKTVQKGEHTFLRKLLPAYYMNLVQNKRTLLPKFFGHYVLRTCVSSEMCCRCRCVVGVVAPVCIATHVAARLHNVTLRFGLRSIPGVACHRLSSLAAPTNTHTIAFCCLLYILQIQ